MQRWNVSCSLSVRPVVWATGSGKAEATWHKAGNTARQSQRSQPQSQDLSGWSAWPCSSSPSSSCDVETRGSSPHRGPAPNHACSSGCSLLKAERASLWIWFNVRNLIPSLPENKLFSAPVGSKWRIKSWAGRNDYVEWAQPIQRKVGYHVSLTKC